MRILVSGSLAYDKIMNYRGRFSDHILPDKIHNLSVSFVTENLSENFGGTAGNIAYNLGLLGEKPVIFSAAGNDFGPYRDWLERAGVDMKHVRIVIEKPTAFATIMTDQGDNQITALYLSTMADECFVTEKDVSGGADVMAVVAAGNLEDMRRFPGLYRDRDIPFVFDPGQQIPSLSAEDLKNGMEGAKVLISNDYELSLIMEKTGWDEQEIMKHVEVLVTTLGSKGSRIRTNEDVFEVPAVPTEKVLDPTGAGDAYRAGFIKGLTQHWPLPIVGRFAGVVAAWAIESYGPQGHSFSFHQCRIRYADAFGQELPS